MPLSAKILITVGAVASTLIVTLLRPKLRLPDWMWGGGTNDPVKRALFDDDGAISPRGRMVIVAVNVIVVIAVWLTPSGDVEHE